MGFDEDAVAERGVAKNAAGSDGAASADFCFAEELDGWLEDGVFADGDVGIDEDGFRKLDGDAVAHKLVAFPFAEGAVNAGEIGAGVAAESFARVGSDFSEDGFARGVEDGDGVGEIDFAMLVIGLYVGESGPEIGGGKAVDAGIDFVEFALIGSELRFLDDGGDGVTGFAEDAAVAGRIGEDGGEDGGGGVAGFVFLEEGTKSFGADERRITREDDDVFGVSDGAFGNEHGVAGAVLGLLENGFDFEGFDGGGNLFGLVADDGDDFFGVERQTGADYMIDERAASGMMQNFGEAGFEAGAFTGGEDEDGCVVIGHGQSIVHWTRSFDNAGMGRSLEVEELKSSIGGGVLGRVASGRGGVFFVGDFPGGGVGQEAAD